MYNEFYKFSEKPFGNTPDPQFLYLTSSHQKALDAMMKGIISRQAFISITGDVGTGKTTLIYSLLTSLDKKVKTAFIFHTKITFEELLRSVIRELGLEVIGKDKRALLHQLIEYLSHIGSDEMVVVIIDEAQQLSKETLLELGELHELAPVFAGRFQIVFVGQLEFNITLQSPDLEVLDRQITTRCEISTLTIKESRDYIEHRLKLVGSSTAKTFTPRAVSEVARYAEGFPRVINNVCDNALLYGVGKAKEKISVKIVREVIKDMEDPSSRKSGHMSAAMKVPHTDDLSIDEKAYESAPSPKGQPNDPPGEDQCVSETSSASTNEEKRLPEKSFKAPTTTALFSSPYSEEKVLEQPEYQLQGDKRRKNFSLIALSLIGCFFLVGMFAYYYRENIMPSSRTQANVSVHPPSTLVEKHKVLALKQPDDKIIPQPSLETPQKSEEIKPVVNRRPRRELPDKNSDVRALVNNQISPELEITAPAAGFVQNTPVRIRTLPGGATIYVDGRPRGTAPATIMISRGNHQIRVSREGYRDADINLNVMETMEFPIHVSLEPDK